MARQRYLGAFCSQAGAHGREAKNLSTPKRKVNLKESQPTHVASAVLHGEKNSIITNPRKTDLCQISFGPAVGLGNWPLFKMLRFRRVEFNFQPVEINRRYTCIQVKSTEDTAGWANPANCTESWSQLFRDFLLSAK